MNDDELAQELRRASSQVVVQGRSFHSVVGRAHRRRRRQLAVLVAAACVVVLGTAVAVTASIRDGEEQSLLTVDRPGATTVTSTSPPTTVTTAPDTTPSRPVTRPATVGDIDGDGIADTVTADGTFEPVTVVHAHMSALGDQDITIEAEGGEDPATAGPRFKGISDLDGNGFGEIWIRTGSGASTVFGAVITLVDDRLAVVAIDEPTSGSPSSTFAIGGSVMHLDGAACLPGGHLALSSSAPTDPTDPNLTTYEVTTTTYELVRDHLRPLQTATATRSAGDVPAGVTGCAGIPEVWE
jgi:hypothetical protein